ncbi:MAG: PTS sugar transporter subunit IIA [Gammaproteobacteria bacterium]
MKLVDLLNVDRILVDPDISSKKRLLENTAQLIADSTAAMTRAEVFDSLISRERLGSTGLGNGIALPHGRSATADKAYASFIRLKEAVTYDAIDGQPVDLVFGLVIPEGGNEDHLQVLAQLAEMFSNQSVVEALRKAKSSDQVHETIANWSPGGTGA